MKKYDNKRIKYSPVRGKPGLFKSSKSIHSPRYDKYYDITIDENTMIFKIYNPLTGENVYTSPGNITSPRVLRRKIRQKMVDLGCNMVFNVVRRNT